MWVCVGGPLYIILLLYTVTAGVWIPDPVFVGCQYLVADH